MSRRKQIYYEYLNSEHWKCLRLKALRRDNFTCQECGTHHNLRVHHLRYRKCLTDCTEGDLLTLCQRCHEALHRRKAKERKERRKAKARKQRRASGYCLKTHVAAIMFEFDAA